MKIRVCHLGLSLNLPIQMANCFNIPLAHMIHDGSSLNREAASRDRRAEFKGLAPTSTAVPVPLAAALPDDHLIILRKYALVILHVGTVEV